MKLLFIGSLPPPVGGDAIWAKNFLKHLSAHDYEVSIVNTSIIGSRALELGTSYNLHDEAIRSLKIIIKAFYLSIFFNPNIVHLNSNCAPLGLIRDFLTICFVRFRGAPLIFHCHANVPDSVKGSKTGNLFLFLCLRFASKALVLNAYSAAYCNEMSKGKCLIVPNFIDDGDVVSKKSISNLIRTIFFAGHLIRTKGIFELYAVAKLFPSINFILAGLVTNDVKLQVAPDNVKLIGHVGKERMDELFALADVFLFPTYTEGFSMALLEAMARGLPVITTPVGANVEMLESCGGIVVAVGDVQGISNGIEFLQFKNVREAMSNWNISKVRSDYCASKVVDRIMNIYKSLIVN